MQSFSIEQSVSAKSRHELGMLFIGMDERLRVGSWSLVDFIRAWQDILISEPHYPVLLHQLSSIHLTFLQIDNYVRFIKNGDLSRLTLLLRFYLVPFDSRLRRLATSKSGHSITAMDTRFEGRKVLECARDRPFTSMLQKLITCASAAIFTFDWHFDVLSNTHSLICILIFVTFELGLLADSHALLQGIYSKHLTHMAQFFG